MKALLLVAEQIKNIIQKYNIYVITNVIDRSSHREVFYKIVVLHLWSKTFKNTGEGVYFLVKLQAVSIVTL